MGLLFESRTSTVMRIASVPFAIADAADAVTVLFVVLTPEGMTTLSNGLPLIGVPPSATAI